MKSLTQIVKPLPKDDLISGKIIWDFMKLDHELEEADAIIMLGSSDMLPAEHGANLYLEGLAPYLMSSGGSGGNKYGDSDGEGEKMAKIAESMGVERIVDTESMPKRGMLVETKADNTAANYDNARKIFDELGIVIDKLVSVHMPFAERRDLYTIKKVWPEIEIIMSSPDVPFEEYHNWGFQGNLSQRDLIACMIGDFQRLFVYSRPPNEFMVPQERPLSETVREAYDHLADRGYQDNLIRYEEGQEKAGEVIPIE